MVKKLLKLTVKTPERHQWRGFCAFTVNFKHIPHYYYCWLWKDKCFLGLTFDDKINYVK